MGRRSKLNKQVQETICKVLRSGNYRTVAARLAGIDERTLYRWLEKGEEAKRGKYRQFCRAVMEAEAQGQAALVAQINVAAKDTWQAAAWILERKYPDLWGRRDAVTLGGTLHHTGDTIHGEKRDETPEERRALSRATAAYFRSLRRGTEQPAGPGDAGGPDVGAGTTPRGAQ